MAKMNLLHKIKEKRARNKQIEQDQKEKERRRLQEVERCNHEYQEIERLLYQTLMNGNYVKVIWRCEKCRHSYVENIVLDASAP